MPRSPQSPIPNPRHASPVSVPAGAKQVVEVGASRGEGGVARRALACENQRAVVEELQLDVARLLAFVQTRVDPRVVLANAAHADRVVHCRPRTLAVAVAAPAVAAFAVARFGEVVP